MKNRLKKIFDSLINIAFVVVIVLFSLLFIQLFFVTSFKIPSDSMEPALDAGDYILVNKLIPGARLFNIFDSLDEKQVKIYRLPGVRKIRHNDVVVFHFPHPYTWEKVEMHIMKYYVKRCVGLPGDSLAIENGLFRVNGETGTVGSLESQQRIGRTRKEQFSEGVFQTFPFDSVMGWNIQNFGPFYIPRKGDRVEMNYTNYLFYHKLIAWEQRAEVVYKDSTVYLGEEPIDFYTFQKNYYFMAGDNGENSQDSRYWGLLPEEYIVGKAWMIWKSVHPYTGKLQWERIGKTL